MLQPIVKHVTYPIWERLNGTRDLRTLRQLQHWESLSRPALLDLQRRRLRAMLEHAHQTIPFYAEWFSAHDFRPRDFDEPEALRQLPLLDKTTINAAGDRMISTAVDRRTILRDSTGGSTGQPLYFYLDEARKSYVRALTLRENAWLGCRPGDRIARFWGSGRDERVPQTLRGRVAASLVRRHRIFDAYQLADDKIESFLTGLGEYRPAIVIAYARAMFLAATYAEQHRLTPYRPRAIVVTSETVSPEERETIARVFRAPVVNRYASRECGQVASGCGRSSLLHVNDDSVILQVEPLPLAGDSAGRLVVTDLTNRVMPLIRYDTGDHGVLAGEECPCGRPFSVLADVEGRILDLFVRADGGRVPGIAFVHLFRQGQAIRNFQVVQHAIDRVEVRLVLADVLDGAAWGKIVEGIRTILGDPQLDVTRTDCDTIETAVSGKHRYAISHVTVR